MYRSVSLQLESVKERISRLLSRQPLQTNSPRNPIVATLDRHFLSVLTQQTETLYALLSQGLGNRSDKPLGSPTNRELSSLPPSDQYTLSADPLDMHAISPHRPPIHPINRTGTSAIKRGYIRSKTPHHSRNRQIAERPGQHKVISRGISSQQQPGSVFREGI